MGGGGHQIPRKWKKKTFVRTIFQISTWKVLIIKNKFLMKNLTDFRETVETRVDPRLILLPFYLRNCRQNYVF